MQFSAKITAGECLVHAPVPNMALGFKLKFCSQFTLNLNCFNNNSGHVMFGVQQ